MCFRYRDETASAPRTSSAEGETEGKLHNSWAFQMLKNDTHVVRDSLFALANQ
jgi:hypothetical protein